MTNAAQLQAQGIKLFQQKDYEAAGKAFQQALEAYTGLNDPLSAAEQRVNLGLVHRSLDENQQALDQMQAALQVFNDHGDNKRVAITLGNLGRVYRALGDKEQAYQCYSHAADIFQELGEKKLHGETLLAIGDLQMNESKYLAAAATYEEGYKQIGDLTARQKFIKGLNGFLTRFAGGQG
jgi:tetratricopeptide (TPR) repeat protein